MQKETTTSPAFGNGYPKTVPDEVCGYKPGQYRSAYGVGSTSTGAGVTVAIIDAYGSATIDADATQYFKANDSGNPFSNADFTQADWDEVMEVNLGSIFRFSQAVVRGWLAQKRRGKIIHTASMLSFQGGIRVVSYTAAKSGLAGLTRAMANELAGQGINVNAIAPGYMATDNTAQLRADPDRNTAILARIPAGLRCTPRRQPTRRVAQRIRSDGRRPRPARRRRAAGDGPARRHDAGAAHRPRWRAGDVMRLDSIPDHIGRELG